MNHYVISYDIGTTGAKTCLYSINDSIELIASDLHEYPLFILENGGAEQDVDDWWQALCLTTKGVLEESRIRGDQIEGISFCSQMQGLVLVDRDGNALTGNNKRKQNKMAKIFLIGSKGPSKS